MDKEQMFGGGGKNLSDAIWKRVRLEMIALILKGEFENGQIYGKTYSLTEMTQKFGCGKSTAQKVLDNMCDEKILYGVKGIGYFVNYREKGLVESLRKEYDEIMQCLLDEYISMGRKIGIDNRKFKEIVSGRLETI